MIGRESESRALRAAVDRACAQGSAFLLVVGEPGIGKTTLLGHLADLAADAQMVVGRARSEPDATAPLWPFLAAATTAARRDGPYPPPAAQLAGEIPSDASIEGTGLDRFALFERFAAEIGARAAAEPLALVVDDLQWADLSTLRLFRHLVDRPSWSGLLVAGALRTTEPLTADAADAVSGLLSHPAVEVIDVPSLADDEVARYAAAQLDRHPETEELTILAERSGGNPFFLGELLRWLPTGAAGPDPAAYLPLAVRESVRRRVVAESAATQLVIKAAAVAGSAASIGLLGTVTSLATSDVADALDAGARAGLLVVGGSDPASVAFAHDLGREAVRSMLSTWEQIELNHAVGAALLGGERPVIWAVVAAHLRVARPFVDAATLADATTRAAAEAQRAGAFDEAADHLALALELDRSANDTAERGRLLLRRGQALWAAGRAPEAAADLAEAAAIGRRVGDAELLALTALSWSGGEVRPSFRRVDHQLLALLSEALAACPDDARRLRCLLLARLARCRHWDLGDPISLAATDEAVGLARDLADADALGAALGTAFYYRWRPELPDERLALADEMVEVAAVGGDHDLVVDATAFRILALLDLGRLREAWDELDRLERTNGSPLDPLRDHRLRLFRAARALALGDRAGAEEASAGARDLARRMGRPEGVAEALGLTLVLLATDRRVDGVRALLDTGGLDPFTYNVLVAVTGGLAGHEQARAALRAVLAEGVDHIAEDMSWLFNHCGLLAAAVTADDREAGAVLYDRLVPHAGRWAVLNPGIAVIGAVDHFLGIGAALLGRLDDAIAHLRRAVVAHEGQAAVALASWSMGELATALARRARPGDDAEASSLEHNRALLDARNTVPFTPLLSERRSRPSTSTDDRRQRLVLEGDMWLVEFAGSRARLRDQRGLHHLRSLLQRPGAEIPALVLAGADPAIGGRDDATVLDDRALRDYRQRVIDLRDDVERATTDNDIERAAEARAELDTLVEHLAGATGVGGRSRRFTGVEERARVSVTKAIRTAIAQLGLQLPELEQHLTATVHTGKRCAYRPDPRAAIPWETDPR